MVQIPWGMQAEKGDTIETRMSLLQRQLGIGEACTFRLIEKNVTSLLPKSKEQLREDAKTSLSDLLRSHPFLPCMAMQLEDTSLHCTDDCQARGRRVRKMLTSYPCVQVISAPR